ncbi:MAG: hypothetical protein KZQ93_18515 [Candidatus Thiodiazotropha sp. (ex Monitilora ramsayi)]|nr:hypothetical protein [Candidatus Thiodiazotropha sp. (ex Monitilora ramsayi)]
MRNNLPAMTIRPGQSRHQLLFLVGTHLSAIAALIIAPLDPIPQFLLQSLVLLHAGYCQRRYYSSDYGKRISIARIQSDGSVELTLESGDKKRGKISRETVMTPWLLILRFTIRHQFRPEILLLWTDTLPPDELRRLRVLLRFSRIDQ